MNRNRLRKVFAYLLVAGGMLFLAATGRADQFTLEQVMSSPFPSMLVSSAQGGRVAWVFNARGVRNVWVADAPRFDARQVTQYSSDDGQPISSLRLSPDGQTVVYSRGSATNNAGQVADPTGGIAARSQQVWAMDVDGKVPRLLGEMGCPGEGCENIQISPDGKLAVWVTRHQVWIAPLSGKAPARQLTGIRGNNYDPQWSPDGHRIAFVSSRGDHSFITVYELDSNVVQYIAPGLTRDAVPRWSPDGHSIVFIRCPGVWPKQPLMIPEVITPWSIWLHDLSSGKTREIWRSGQKANDSIYYWFLLFPSNDQIVFASEQDGRNHLYSLPINGGASTLLTPGEYDVEEIHLSEDRKSILYTSNQDDADRRHIWRVFFEKGKPEQITHGEGIEWNPIETGQGKYLLCLASTATVPAMPYVLTDRGMTMIAGTALPAEFPSDQLIHPRQVIFRSQDGLEVHGQLFLPRGITKAAPALIYMHGGPERQMLLGFHYGDYYHNTYAMNQYLASRGYVILSVNYRTGIMYGHAFREALNGGWQGAAEYQDILAAAKFLQSLPSVDRNRIGLWGGSYGGYLTALGLARNSDLFAAGVDMHGLHDWSNFAGTWDSAPEDAPDLPEAKKLAFESSPDAAVSKWKSPVLLILGDDDRNVPFNQSVDLEHRLKERNVHVEELVFPDEVHNFLLWKNWMRAFEATAEFFDRTLKSERRDGGDD